MVANLDLEWLMESEQATPCGLNKGHGSKFHVGSQVQETPEEGQRTHRPKCEYNKFEDSSLKTSKW